jgi:hypothetical protein
MEGYWDFREGVRDIMGDKERYWAVTGFLNLSGFINDRKNIVQL